MTRSTVLYLVTLVALIGVLSIGADSKSSKDQNPRILQASTNHLDYLSPPENGRAEEHAPGGGGRPTEPVYEYYKTAAVLLILAGALLLWAVGYLLFVEGYQNPNSFFTWATSGSIWTRVFFVVVAASIIAFYSGLFLLGIFFALVSILIVYWRNPGWTVWPYLLLVALVGLSAYFFYIGPERALLGYIFLVLAIVGLIYAAGLIPWNLDPYWPAIMLALAGIVSLSLESVVIALDMEVSAQVIRGSRLLGSVFLIFGALWFMIAAGVQGAGVLPFLRILGLILAAAVLLDRGYRVLQDQHLMFWHKYYKLCDEDCAMHGSVFGDRFDEPCGDNIAFMVYHTANNISIQDFITSFDTVPLSPPLLPSIVGLPVGLAHHNPIFPDTVDNVTYTLEGINRPIESAKLYIRQDTITQIQFNKGQAPSCSLDESNLVASWSRIPRSWKYRKETFGGTVELVSEIDHTYCPPGVNCDVELTDSLILNAPVPVEYYLRCYKFEFEFVGGVRDTITITHALNPYLPKNPAPIYAQGDPKEVMDVVLIPAVDAWNPTIDRYEFRESCGNLIRNVIRNEPNIRFWNKQFNFWINPIQGYASESCDNCCHGPPENIDSLSFAEAKALLHKSVFRDFAQCGTDINCASSDCSLFSAEMLLYHDLERYEIEISDDSVSHRHVWIHDEGLHDEIELYALIGNAFLHELGHTLFYLRDEYVGGWNGEDEDQFPNNWNRVHKARKDSYSRHKNIRDVNSVH